MRLRVEHTASLLIVSAAAPAALALGAPAGEPAPAPARDAAAIEEEVRALQRHCAAEIRRARGLPRGSEERADMLRGIVAHMEGKAERYLARDRPDAARWLRYDIERVKALAGSPGGAYRQFDFVIGERYEGEDEGARQWIGSLRESAFHMKAKAAFEAGDYERCVVTAADMLTSPCGLPDWVEEWHGCAAVLLMVRALGKLDLDGHPEAEEAAMRFAGTHRGNPSRRVRDLVGAVDHVTRMGGEVERPKAVAASERGEPVPRQLDPWSLVEAAREGHRAALAEADPAKRSALLEDAVARYRAAIAACRAHGATSRVRLEVEPGAWLALGTCYAELGLRYEAALAFEGLLTRFSREKVGRYLAGRTEHRWLWEELAERAGPPGPGGATRDLHVQFYRELERESPEAFGFERHERRLTESAEKLVAAMRSRLRESSLAFDEGLLRRAERIVAPYPEDGAGEEREGPVF